MLVQGAFRIYALDPHPLSARTFGNNTSHFIVYFTAALRDLGCMHTYVHVVNLAATITNIFVGGGTVWLHYVPGGNVRFCFG